MHLLVKRILFALYICLE